ncbi:hypothetical protein O23A_p2673 [Aeromonas salmonicida]|nr:hypothetical protein O23A_p2673 [Aeromonas salmonicida]
MLKNEHFSDFKYLPHPYKWSQRLIVTSCFCPLATPLLYGF